MVTFHPVNPQKWDICAGFAKALESKSGKFELRFWLGLGLFSLGIAGVFALLIAISRIPNTESIFPWPIKFFEKGLIIHVIFSFIIWFLSIFSAMLTIVTYRLSNGPPRFNLLGGFAGLMAIISCFLLLIPGLRDSGEASLNNYIPIIIEPMYYFGLFTFNLAIILQILRLAINFFGREGPFEPVAQAIVVGSVLFTIAIISFLISWEELKTSAIDPSFNENLFWASGHILQFLNALLMLLAWYILGGLIFEQPILHPKTFRLILFIFLLIGATLLSFVLFLDPISSEGRELFTLAQYLMLPPILIFLSGAIIKLLEIKHSLEKSLFSQPPFVALTLSLIVFMIGGWLGIFVDGTDTRTPAHYHGVIGGINIAFIGIFFYFAIPIIKKITNKKRPLLTILWAYAIGQILHSLGLFFAGGYGAPRKTAGNLDGIAELGAEISLYMMGVGAVIAVIGGILFVYIGSKTLLNST